MYILLKCFVSHKAFHFTSEYMFSPIYSFSIKFCENKQIHETKQEIGGKMEEALIQQQNTIVQVHKITWLIHVTSLHIRFWFDCKAILNDIFTIY